MARVLLVEDDPASRYVMRRALEQAKLDVVEATNGREGLDRQRSEPADVIVTDISMPEMNGLELLEIIREEFPWVPVIATTGHTTGDGRDYLPTASYLGAFKVLSKPFEMAALVTAISEVLARP
jgi:CheY-like chemotaxis protein